jgi:hypothetical protein
MGIQLTCDHCRLLDGGDRGVLYALGSVGADQHQTLEVRLYEYPTLLHWGCIIGYVAARDLMDKEPPF